jgi:hypothetical protein
LQVCLPVEAICKASASGSEKIECSITMRACNSVTINHRECTNNRGPAIRIKGLLPVRQSLHSAGSRERNAANMTEGANDLYP